MENVFIPSFYNGEFSVFNEQTKRLAHSYLSVAFCWWFTYLPGKTCLLRQQTIRRGATYYYPPADHR